MIVKVKNTFINVEVQDELLLSRKDQRPHSWPLAAKGKSAPRSGGAAGTPSPYLDNREQLVRRRTKATSQDRRLMRQRSSDVASFPEVNHRPVLFPVVAAVKANEFETSSDNARVAPKAIREGARHLCNVSLGVEARFLQEAFRDWSGRARPEPCDFGCKATITDDDVAKACIDACTALPPPRENANEKVVRQPLAYTFSSTGGNQFRRRRHFHACHNLVVLRKLWRTWLSSSSHLAVAALVLGFALLSGSMLCFFRSSGPPPSVRIEVRVGDYQSSPHQRHMVGREFTISGLESKLGLLHGMPAHRNLLGASSLGMLEKLGGAISKQHVAEHQYVPPLNPISSPRAEKSMRAIVEEMNRFAGLQPQLKGLPQHIVDQIVNRAKELDDVLFELQQRGHVLRGRGIAARGNVGMAAASQHQSSQAGQQFLTDLEQLAAAQATFVHQVDEVTRARHMHLHDSGYISYRPKDLR